MNTKLRRLAIPLCLFFTLPVSSYDSTSGNPSGLEFHFSTRLHWIPGFVHWNQVESIGHEWKKINKLPLSIKGPPLKKAPSLYGSIVSWSFRY